MKRDGKFNLKAARYAGLHGVQLEYWASGCELQNYCKKT